MAVSERIHLVLEPYLMKAFREMAEKNRRSVSGQLAFMVEGEIDRQRAAPHSRAVGIPPTARMAPIVLARSDHPRRRGMT